MPYPDIFARCDVSSTTSGALPREIIDFLLSPGGHSLLIKGDAGTGKTTMALQLIEGLSDQQPEYYLSSRVSDVALYHQFPWLKERVEKNQLMRAGMAFLRRSWNSDGSKRKDLEDVELHVERRELNRLEGQIEAGELGMEDDEGPAMNPDGSITVEVGSMLPELEMAYDIAESNLPKKTLVVLDSVEALAENYGIPAYRIMNALQKDLVEKAGTNVVFVMETAERNHLDYLGDGIVVLHNSVVGSNRVRTIDIEKLRGSSIRNWRYLFTLEGGRVTVVDRDPDLQGMDLTRNGQDLPAGRGSFGWAELDRLFGGAPLGSLTLIEIGAGLPMELLERLETALVGEHLRHGRGVLWYPQRTLDYKSLQVRMRNAPLDTLHVLDASEAEGGRSFVKKMEGADLANDLRWDSLKYLLKDSREPYLSVLGLDALESVYGKVIPKLMQHVDLMRRGGHMVILEATDGLAGLETLSHQARLHFRLENLNGSVLLRGIKPATICHCLDVTDGIPLWKPML
ncbi:MAG: RAD55 family ATPase [Methanomassiliicoccales archaeon]